MRNSLFGTLFILSVVIIFGSCNFDGSGNANESEAMKEARTAYNTEANQTTGNNYIKAIMDELANTDIKAERRSELLELGYEVATDQRITARRAAFLFPIVKNNIGDPSNISRLFDLGVVMRQLEKSSAANTIFKGIIDQYPDFGKVSEAQSAMSEPIENIDDYIQKLGESIFADPDNTGINRQASLFFVDACEAYATVYNNSPKAPEYLFKAAEVAKSIRTYPKSLSLYDWIVESYPDYEKSATSLFLKGFIIENNLGDDEKAKEIYDLFLEKHPSHDLADDVQFLLENLGKTDEEILEMIEAKRKEREAN